MISAFQVSDRCSPSTIRSELDTCGGKMQSKWLYSQAHGDRLKQHLSTNADVKQERVRRLPGVSSDSV